MRRLIGDGRTQIEPGPPAVLNGHSKVPDASFSTYRIGDRMPVLVIWTKHEGENWPTPWFHGLCHPECHPAEYTNPRSSSEMPQKIANAGPIRGRKTGGGDPAFWTAVRPAALPGFARLCLAPESPPPVSISTGNYIESYIRSYARSYTAADGNSNVQTTEHPSH
jgi:hypothetical protein